MLLLFVFYIPLLLLSYTFSYCNKTYLVFSFLSHRMTLPLHLPLSVPSVLSSSTNDILSAS